jgi:putative transposase
MEQKLEFVSLYGSGRFTKMELCLEFGISRKTGDKWLNRYAQEGLKGLDERSRAPKSVANRTTEKVERLICAEKRKHPTWGPKKIRRRLETKHGLEKPPAVSTVGEVLKRHGMVAEKKRRGGVFKVERGTRTPPEHCNHVLGVDFKGWFLTGDGERFDPLTVTDLHSRYLMRAEGLPQATTKWTQRALRSMFMHYGIPDNIPVDK